MKRIWYNTFLYLQIVLFPLSLFCFYSDFSFLLTNKIIIEAFMGGIALRLFRKFSLLVTGSGWSPMSQSLQFHQKLNRENTCGVTGPRGGPIHGHHKPIPVSDCLAFWLCMLSFPQHAMQSIFGGWLNYKCFYLIQNAISDHKNKLVVYLGTNVGNLAGNLCLRHRDPEKKGAPCGKSSILYLRQE